MRGYCGIGIYHSKTEVNLGTLWRSAFCLGADFVFTIGRRYKPQASDTQKAYRHIPLWHFKTLGDYRQHIPYDCQTIGIEILDSARQLQDFIHPQRAIYLLGAEDNGLSKEAIKICQAIVQFPSEYCLNVSVAGSIVLYDRNVKSNPRQERSE